VVLLEGAVDDEEGTDAELVGAAEDVELVEATEDVELDCERVLD